MYILDQYGSLINIDCFSNGSQFTIVLVGQHTAHTTRKEKIYKYEIFIEKSIPTLAMTE